MSSMSLACAFAFLSMTSTARSMAGVSNCRFRSSAVQPRIAFSGVRSSCESVARKSSFNRLVSSASIRARCSEAATLS